MRKNLIIICLIAASGLLQLSCTHQPVKPPFTVSGELALLQLQRNAFFIQDESGNFETSPEATDKIRIYIHQFADLQGMQSYVLNRRMLLHKGFQDQIAPYFGLIQLNRACLAKVNTKGDVQAIDKSEEFMKMQFPANDSRTLSDCSTDKFWGSIEYHFHNCKKNHTVYEIRISRKDGEPPASLQPRCQ